MALAMALGFDILLLAAMSDLFYLFLEGGRGSIAKLKRVVLKI